MEAVNATLAATASTVAANSTVASSLFDSLNVLAVTLAGNQVFSGGFALCVFGALSAIIYPLWLEFSDWLKRKFYLEVTVESSDPLYSWCQLYLAQLQKQKAAETHVRATTISSLDNEKYDLDDQYDEHGNFVGSSKEIAHLKAARITFIPKPGLFIFFFRKKMIWLRMCTTMVTPSVRDNYGAAGGDVMTFSTWGRDRNIFLALFNEAREEFFKTRTSLTSVWIARSATSILKIPFFRTVHGNSWIAGQSKKKRPIDSVILKAGMLEKLLADVRRFYSSAEFYHQLGVPYRRGYLLYGPPGTGKTSTILAVAGELGLDICIISLSAPNMNDSTLAYLVSTSPARSIILLEDVDVAIAPPSEARPLHGGAPGSGDGEDSAAAAAALEELRNNRVTLSGLLNCVDGVASGEGRLFFMSTNHIEKLAPSLIRPGRVDVRLFVDFADEDQVQRLFHKFFHLSIDPALAKDSANPHLLPLDRPLLDLPSPGSGVAAPSALPLSSLTRVDQLSRRFVEAIRPRIGNITTAELQAHFMTYRDSAEEAVDNAGELLVENRDLMGPVSSPGSPCPPPSVASQTDPDLCGDQGFDNKKVDLPDPPSPLVQPASIFASVEPLNIALLDPPSSTDKIASCSAVAEPPSSSTPLSESDDETSD